MNTFPLVSIVIPSYNYGKYIGRAIASARAQSYPNLEIVISDNASTDDSLEIIQSHAAQDERIRFWVNDTNIGVIPNFNLVRERSRGDYVVYLCADDIFYPGHISEAMTYYIEHPECDLRHTAWTHIDADGRTMMVCPHPGNRGTTSISARDEFAFNFTTSGHVRWQSVVFPRRVFEEIGDLDEHANAADTDFLFRCARAGMTFAYDGRPFVGLMQHSEAASSRQNFRNTGRQLHAWLTIYDDNITSETAPRLVGTRLRTSTVIENAVRYVQDLPEPSPREILEREGPLLERVRAKIEAIPDKSSDTSGSDPKFTVILATRGRLDPLLRSAASVLAQTESSWELVIAGDCGRDIECVIRGTYDDKRVVYAQTSRTGEPSAARNLALRIARGETIAYLEEGDTYDTDYLAALRRLFDATDADIVRGTAHAAFFQMLEREQRSLIGTDGDLFARATDPFVDGLGIYLPLSAIAHRKYCYERVGEFNENLPVLEQWEFVLRLVAHGSKFTIAHAPDAHVTAGYNGALLYQQLGERLSDVPQAFSAIFGAITPVTEPVLVARRNRLERVVQAANAFLANRAQIEPLHAFIKVLYGRSN